MLKKLKTSAAVIALVCIVFANVQLVSAALPLAASLPQQASIISRWGLDEENGARADSVGTNTLADNNSVLSGNGLALANATSTYAADFELDSTESLSIADATQTGLDLSTDFTFSVWVKQESAPAEQAAFFAKMGVLDANESYYFGSWNNAGSYYLRAFFEDASNNITVGYVAKTLTNGVWYHVVCAVDISEHLMDFYADGVYLGASTYSAIGATSIRNSTASFSLGYRLDPANSLFDGLMQDAIVWNKYLTSSEVLSLYKTYTEAQSSSPTGVPQQIIIISMILKDRA